MKQNKLTYKTLTNFNRLPEIYSLTHDTFVESGLILPKENGQLNLYPHLNEIKETTIIIAECDGQIIATNSVTLDGEMGLHTDMYFKEEMDFLRKNNSNLGSSWRIATKKEFRGNIRVLMNLIKHSLTIGKEKGMKSSLFIFEKKNERIYKKLIGAKTIAEKVYNTDPNVNHQMHMVLMIADVEQVSNSLGRKPSSSKTIEYA